jgi:hypothetical protein
MDTHTAILVAAFWAFAGSLGFGVFAFMRFLSDPRYRDSRGGDISTEVGYETDPYGSPKGGEEEGGAEAPSGVAGDIQMGAAHQGPSSNF